MKKFVVVLAAAAFMVALPSCKKCTTCKYTYTSGGSTTTFTYPETCGKKKDLDAIESTCKTAASAYSGASCTCDKS
jgi:NADH:ubiquinone oxidoreductase subunit F (NADH-binding)